MLIELNKALLQRYCTCLAAASFSFYNLAQFVLFNIVGHDIALTFKLTSIGLGAVNASYLICNALGLVVAGILLVKFPIRYVILTVLTMTILATLLLSLSTYLYCIVLLRGIQGLSGAFSLLLSIRVATECFPKQISIVIGSVVGLALLGGISGSLFFTNINQLVGWRMTVAIDGALGLLFFIIIYIGLKPKISHTIQLYSGFHLKKLFNTLVTKQNLLLGAYIGLTNTVVFILSGLWGVHYLITDFSQTPYQAALTSSLIFWGVIIGSPTIGLLTYIMTQKYLMYLTAVLSIAIVLSMILLSVSYVELRLFFFCLGFLSSSQILGYAFIAEHTKCSIYSLAIPGIALIENGIGACVQIIYGYLLKAPWNDHFNLAKNHFNIATVTLLMASFFCLLLIKVIDEK